MNPTYAPDAGESGEVSGTADSNFLSNVSTLRKGRVEIQRRKTPSVTSLLSGSNASPTTFQPNVTNRNEKMQDQRAGSLRSRASNPRFPHSQPRDVYRGQTDSEDTVGAMDVLFILALFHHPQTFLYFPYRMVMALPHSSTSIQMAATWVRPSRQRKATTKLLWTTIACMLIVESKKGDPELKMAIAI